MLFTCTVHKKYYRGLVNNAASSDVTLFPMLENGGGVRIRAIFVTLLYSIINLALI